MFGDIWGAIALAKLRMDIEIADQKAFEAYLETIPPEAREAARADRAAKKERDRQEAIAERRHQELCRAIRDSRLHGIGMFW